MEIYSDYKIKLHEISDYFIQILDTILSRGNGWKHRYDLEEGFSENAILSDKAVYCVETPEIIYENVNIKGVIWMWRYDHSMEIFNITPAIGNHLTCSQYNYIIKQFNDNVIPLCPQDVIVGIEQSKTYFDILDHISAEALEALKFFSRTSNRSTGHTHPNDFRKWCDFIFKVHRLGGHLSADELMNWLIEDGWPKDTADELSLDYEYSLLLLEEYEKD